MTENSYLYSRETMPNTPGGREVREIAGNPDAIIRHAADIERLGEKMARAARTLQLFADGTVGKGKSFEAIRDQAKEVHADLATAADRYLPSGEALAAYGHALSTAQSSTGWRVSGAERTWEDVRSASQALSGASSDLEEWERNERQDIEQTGTAPTTAAGSSRPSTRPSRTGSTTGAPMTPRQRPGRTPTTAHATVSRK